MNNSEGYGSGPATCGTPFVLALLRANGGLASGVTRDITKKGPILLIEISIHKCLVHKEKETRHFCYAKKPGPFF